MFPISQGMNGVESFDDLIKKMRWSGITICIMFRNMPVAASLIALS